MSNKEFDEDDKEQKELLESIDLGQLVKNGSQIEHKEETLLIRNSQ